MSRFTLQSLRSRKKSTVKILTLAAVLFITHQSVLAQQQNNAGPNQGGYETYGHTLNVGIGAGYFGYLGQSVPFVFADYEFDVAHGFTLAPFIGFASYQTGSNYYYGNGYYYYRETVVPVGVKGTYYFDRLLHLNRRWDLYGAASLGFVFDNVTWQAGYEGPSGAAHTASPLYLDLHVGSEYHFSRNVGVFLDLSTGVSTVGLAFHHL
jgi:hypothetical protein